MDAIQDTLTLVNDWLKFAEAKNALVVTATGVALWALARLIVADETGYYVDGYLSVLVIFLLSAFVVSLLSFLPTLNFQWITPKTSELATRNLLYFGYLSTLSKQQLLEKYREATKSEEAVTTELQGMYAEQIIINSKIAMEKFSMFNRSVKLLLCGILTPLIALPLLHLLKKKRDHDYGIE